MLTFQTVVSFLFEDARKSEHFRVSDGDAAGGVSRGGRFFVAPPLFRLLLVLFLATQEKYIRIQCLQEGIPSYKPEAYYIFYKMDCLWRHSFV